MGALSASVFGCVRHILTRSRFRRELAVKLAGCASGGLNVYSSFFTLVYDDVSRLGVLTLAGLQSGKRSFGGSTHKACNYRYLRTQSGKHARAVARRPFGPLFRSADCPARPSVLPSVATLTGNGSVYSCYHHGRMLWSLRTRRPGIGCDLNSLFHPVRIRAKKLHPRW